MELEPSLPNVAPVSGDAAAAMSAAVSAATESSIEHHVDTARRVVFVTLAGDITTARLHAARDAVFADPAYVPGMDAWIETRVLTSIPTADEVRGLALSAILHRGDLRQGRVAIVATTAKGYEAASCFELFTDAPPDRLAVFTDPSQARAWLVLDAILAPSRPS